MTSLNQRRAFFDLLFRGAPFLPTTPSPTPFSSNFHIPHLSPTIYLPFTPLCAVWLNGYILHFLQPGRFVCRIVVLCISSDLFFFFFFFFFICYLFSSPIKESGSDAFQTSSSFSIRSWFFDHSINEDLPLDTCNRVPLATERFWYLDRPLIFFFSFFYAVGRISTCTDSPPWSAFFLARSTRYCAHPRLNPWPS